MDVCGLLFAAYHVDVKCGSQCWRVTRRYRDFVKLAAELHRSQQQLEEPLPTLPQRRGRSIDAAVIERRVVGLHAWLSAVCARLQFHGGVLAFLFGAEDLQIADRAPSNSKQAASAAGRHSPRSVMMSEPPVAATSTSDGQQVSEQFAAAAQRVLALGGSPVPLSVLSRLVQHVLMALTPQHLLGRVSCFHPAIIVCGTIYLRRLAHPKAARRLRLREVERWPLVVLTLLRLATQMHSDHSDTLMASLFDDSRSRLRACWPQCTAANLRAVELDVLDALEYRLVVTPFEWQSVHPHASDDWQ